MNAPRGGEVHSHAHPEQGAASAPAPASSSAPAPAAAASGGLRGLVVTASNRAARGVYPDKGGPLLAGGLQELGFAVDGPRVVPDGDPVEQALREGVAAGYDVILTTGGTGISPTDRTPDATARVIDYQVPGIPEAIRAESLAHVPTAALSRGLAGVAGRTLIVNLPGSTGGVRDGLAVLSRILPHAVDQIRGGDHPGPPAGAPAGPSGSES
ncbi:molybdenum cofactor biosynthesis protein B [Streptomyces sp. NPDC048603]|uniref:MogA/MoaB family molybdenum cofactor biosynthesis protein n=1 Tax=Streptomyces sp. NPDC048603 TaxID=3365577 RepID=UPI0037213F86